MALVAAQNGQEIVTQILILDPLEGSRVRGENDGMRIDISRNASCIREKTDL